MNDAIFKLAKECGWSLEGIHTPIEQKLEAFYRAAFNAGLEAAAKRSESDTHNYALCIRTLRLNHDKD